MASYHCSVKVGGKGQAGSHAAYIAREGRYGQYESYEDLEAASFGNLPDWAEQQPRLFWQAADRYERANGATYREIEIALPRELNPAQRQELVEDFLHHHLSDRHAYQWAIHNPPAALAGGEQPHAHLMYSERTHDGIDRAPDQYFKRYNGQNPERGGCRKDSAGTEERLLETRQRWAEVQNAHLEQYGHSVRVDHRSLAEQGVDREPEQHLGSRRVRELEPEQREALLERRDAEEALIQAENALLPIYRPSYINDLIAEAQHREQEQERFMAEVWDYCRNAYQEVQAELAQQAEQERALLAPHAEQERVLQEKREPEQGDEPALSAEPYSERILDLEATRAPFAAEEEASRQRWQALIAEFREARASQSPAPQRDHSQDWGMS